jgi:hypothetical protein
MPHPTLGSQIEEGHGKRTGRRIIATEPDPKVEATVEETQNVLGVEGQTIITYTSWIKPDGSLHGEGVGAFLSAQGDMATWRGVGVGKLSQGGAIHYCGSLSFTTTSQKFAKLNGISGVFQWEIDAEGNTHSKTWEYAPTGVSRGAAA